MGHDWIFDVLKDLKSYAEANGLPALAAKAEEAMAIARAEIAANDPLSNPESPPPSRRKH